MLAIEAALQPRTAEPQRLIGERRGVIRRGIQIIQCGHQLRRTYATQFLKAHAGDGQALQKLTSHMRWASIATAASYTDEVSRTELDAAGAKMIEDLLEDS